MLFFLINYKAKICFPEFFRHNTVLDKGLFPITEFLWTSPSSRVSTTIQQIPNGRVQAALFWQDSVKEPGPHSVYKVLWRMLSCHVYQNLEPCYLHDHYNVTLVSVLRNVQVCLLFVSNNFLKCCLLSGHGRSWLSTATSLLLISVTFDPSLFYPCTLFTQTR